MSPIEVEIRRGEMDEIQFVERIPSPEEYNALRESVGWVACESLLVGKALTNSLYCICAYCDREMVGMARVIGDGGLVFYIQDVILKPHYQGKGIGRALMTRAMGYLRQNASSGTVIGLMSAKGKEAFYEPYGFTKRPNDDLGSGMTLLWESDDEHAED